MVTRRTYIEFEGDGNGIHSLVGNLAEKLPRGLYPVFERGSFIENTWICSFSGTPNIKELLEIANSAGFKLNGLQ